MPTYADNPRPPAKIVSASPETIWFARSVMTRNAWIAAIAAPAIADATTARTSTAGAGAVDPLRDPEADRSAEQHHPLDAEVEDSRALGEQLSERRVQERRAVEDRLREHDHEQAVVDAHEPGLRRPAFRLAAA